MIAEKQMGTQEIEKRLADLKTRWEGLNSKAKERRQLLADSLQAQQYYADASEAESWMKEKEPIVGYTDYGKDEDTTEVFLLIHSNLYGYIHR